MITKVKLFDGGYIKVIGRVNYSIIGDYLQDEDVTSFTDEGGIVEPQFTQTELDAIALSKLPKVVTKRQGMRAMKATTTATGTLWSDLQAIFVANQDAKDDYDAVSELDMTDPVLLQLAGALSLSTAQLQELFNLADTM